MPGASIRSAGADDVEACVDLLARLPDYFTPDTHEELRMAMPAHRTWVAVDGDDVIGFALAERRYPSAAEITFAAVVPERQSAGVGTLLVEHLLRELADDGVAAVEVKTLDASAGHEPYVATRPTR